MDKLQHFILCFVVTLIFDWKIGTTMALTIEFTQAEAKSSPLKKPFWKQLFRKDTAFDLVADGIGIGLGLGLGSFLRPLIINLIFRSIVI